MCNIRTQCTMSKFLSGLLPVFMLLFTATHGQYRDGDVRLVGGSYQWEGRVEVYMSGVWGTITDSDWTDDDARVVCRKLGHFRAGAIGYSNAYFGEGGGPVNLDSVQCSGSEYNLTECEIGNSGTRTTHSLDVGVKCQPADGSYRNGDLRLVGGPHNWEGRVEVYWNRVWGAISDPQWSIADANVVCTQLKHLEKSGTIIPCCGVYGVGSGAITMRNVVCRGSEYRINDCSFFTNTSGFSNHQADTQVQCQRGNETNEWDVRLVGGSFPWEGRVEIFYSGSWTTVRSYRSESARVVCTQLGYKNYENDCCRSHNFGQGTGAITLYYLTCDSRDYRLSECHHFRYSGSYHTSDWGVICPIDDSDPFDVRLDDGSRSRGQLQIYWFGSWETVANSLSTWRANNSYVVCRQLGYAPYYSPSSSYYNYRYYHYSNPAIDNVVCTGNESKLINCSYSHTAHYSIKYPTVGVRCQNYRCNDEDLRLIDGQTETEGRVEVCDSNRWGTVCDRRWTPNITALVCKQLGFSDIVGESSFRKFKGGVGPVLIDYISCTGKFWRSGCIHFTHPSGCSHDEDVGVQCQPARCSDGQLRLTDGLEERYGRVEICSDQRWKTFYSYHWSTNNARAVCIELGFNRLSRKYHSTSYGNGGLRHSKYFRCSGYEQRLSECRSFNETALRSAGNDVGVYCYLAYCTDGEMRLMEGETEWEGRLEICLNGRWGTVGGNEWTQINSHVVCNALGYDITDEPANQSIPMALSKPLHYHSIRCSHRDLTLLECGFTRSSPYDYREIDKHAVVKCQESVCEDGVIRLVGGASESEGRLEVCFGKRWGTVDGDGWTHTDTQVVCKQLGHSTSAVAYTKAERERYPTSQTLPAFMTVVGCYGSEERLTDCSYHEFEYSTSASTATTSMDISISCSTNEGSSAAQISGVAIASLVISILLVLTLVLVVVILIAFFVLRRRKKRAQRSHRDLPLNGIYTATGSQYEPDHSMRFNNNNGTAPLDNKMAAEALENYEAMDAPSDLY